MRFMRITLALIFLILTTHALNLDFYYGNGCMHCAATENVLNKLAPDYDLNLTKHEVYYNAVEREKLFSEYERFGYDPNKGGVPTTIIQDTMVVGKLKEEQWRALFNECTGKKCPEGFFSQGEFHISPPTENITTITEPIYERDSTTISTLSILVGAAIVDSFNPCTIAVMVLLISAILYTRGKKEALISGILFTIVIFLMYLIYGVFILNIVGVIEELSGVNVSNLFYIVVTFAALLLSILEINAYFNYRPGFSAVEMPLFLRPYAKKVTSKATSPVGVIIAAIFCSVFLVPCSSGPYLMVLGMIGEAATLQALSYLLLYNLIFVLPMFLITIAVYLGRTTIENVGGLKDKYVREIHLLSGIILFFLFLLMLSLLIGIF